MSFSTIIPKELTSEYNIKNIEIPQNTISMRTDKMTSHIVPDSPPTMFISANSSPTCNVVTDKEDQYSSIGNFYSLFPKMNEGIKTNDLNNNYFSYNATNSTNNIGTISSCNNPLLPPSLVNNNQNSNHNINNMNTAENALKNNVDLLNNCFPFTGSQIEWNNAINAYYQQLAFYNQMIMSMYSPILANVYSNANINPLFTQMFNNWTNLQSMGSGSFNYADLQTSQVPNMASLASLSQIPVGNGNVNSSSGNLSVTNSPVHSSQSISSSLLSPVNTTQTTVSKSSINNIDNFEVGKNNNWSSKTILESSIPHNSIIGVSKTTIRNENRKIDKARKTIKPNFGGRRKIDKSSAICVVCGTTQTSQWRFLNLSELYITNNKEENSSSLKLENNENDLKTEQPMYVDKQICCNACYMKYDRNRPRYRNGKKVPPPLPSYIYTHNQYINNKVNNHLKHETSLLESE